MSTPLPLAEPHGPLQGRAAPLQAVQPAAAASAAGQAARFWYMDSLRAALMIGGVFYHAALVYAPNADWRVRDPSDIAAFELLANVLSAFRMPAFFFIAGFFCSFMFNRGTPVQVLRKRLVVLGLPFLTMALTLQPLQYALKLAGPHHAPVHGTAEFLAGYVGSGAFVSHLWFLLNLIVYYAVVTAWLSSPPRWRAAAARLLEQPWALTLARHKLPGAIVACAVILMVDHTIGAWGLGKQFDVDVMFRYAPFFIAGALAFVQPKWLEAMLHVGAADVLVAVVLVAASSQGWLEGRTLVLATELQFYLVGFVLAAWLVRLCRTWLNRRSWLQQDLVDAAFSIYLFHHICVIVAAMALMAFAPALHPLLKYAIVVAVGCVVPYALHAGVLRHVGWLRLLFNGRTARS